MSNKAHFLPTNTTILPLYFGSGLIMPGKYYKGFLNTFQNGTEGTIIISEDKWPSGANCSLEIILTDEERDRLIPIAGNSGLFTLNTGLPISRIKNISFSDSTQMEHTIWNIENGTAFVPHRMLSTSSNPQIKLHNFKGDAEIKNDALVEDLAKKARQFDILLGGFAFMKIAASTSTNFPHNYFSTLAYFNSLISDQVKAADSNYNLGFDYSYTGLFTENSNWQYWKPFIYKDIKDKDLEEIAQHQNIKLEKKVGQIRLDALNVDSLFYDLVLLNTYGENKKKGLEDLFSFLAKNDLTDKKREEIALLFGVHIGYSKLRRIYRVMDKEVAVKFQLESQLDYYTIESLYQYVFNNNSEKTKEVRELDYLIPLLPKAKSSEVKTNLTTYRILDTTVVAKKKEAVSKEQKSSYSGLWEAIAIEVSSWQNAHPFFQPDIKAIQQFFENKFGATLNKLTTVNTAKQDNESAKPQVPDNDTALLPVYDEWDRLTFLELKKHAKKHKVEIPPQMTGTSIDMNELKTKLRKALIL